MVQIRELQLNTNILSLGSLLGSSGQQDLINNINAQCGGGSFFGSMNDPFRTNFQSFMSTVVEPIRQVQQTLLATATQLLKPDTYRPITNERELEAGIPPCMHMGIIYYAPVRQMLEEERIDGFGIDPKTLEDEDPFASVLASGHVEIHSDFLGPKGEYEVSYLENTTDPILTTAEIEALRETRAYIDNFMNDDETSARDFTDCGRSLHC